MATGTRPPTPIGSRLLSTGHGLVEWMGSPMGLTVEEMGQAMADGDYGHGGYGMYGTGGGCSAPLFRVRRRHH